MQYAQSSRESVSAPKASESCPGLPTATYVSGWHPSSVPEIYPLSSSWGGRPKSLQPGPARARAQQLSSSEDGKGGSRAGPEPPPLTASDDGSERVISFHRLRGATAACGGGRRNPTWPPAVLRMEPVRIFGFESGR
eukprot:scaffold3743_cov389-Prasinococcus_capsulatus_cf.AAC.11